MSKPDDTGSIADQMIRSGYERWHRLEQEKQAISEDLKELFAELKADGFDTKALRAAFREVASVDDLAKTEHEALVDLYVQSITIGTKLAMRGTREAEPEHDADGVIIEPNSATASSPRAMVERATGTPSDGLHDAGEAAVAPQVEASPAEIQPPVSAAQTGRDYSAAPNSSPEHEAVESSGPVSPAGEVAADKSGEAPVASPAPPVTDYVVFFDADADARCRKPEQCGSFSRLGVCQPCREAWEADHPQKVAAE